jgi:hypothetical protein
MTTADNAGRWSRAKPRATGPDRRAGGFYRASGQRGRLGGVPVKNVEDAVVAAVRMGYKVAEAQIDRSNRLARRLRKAGEQAAGPDVEQKSVDAVERLVFRSMMSGLSWLESLSAKEGSPLMNLLDVEYRLLGRMLGLRHGDDDARAGGAKRADGSEHKPGPAVVVGSGASKQKAPALQIHLTPRTSRPVLVRRFDVIVEGRLPSPIRIRFYPEGDEGDPFDATLESPKKGAATLKITPPDKVRRGPWRGAVCNSEGLQLGLIEIEI